MTPNSDNSNYVGGSDSASAEDSQRMIGAISMRAYYLWENAGRPDGRDDDFWFQAESEISAQQGG